MLLDDEPRSEEIPAADGAGVTLNALDVWSDQADDDSAPLPGACKPDLQADVELGRIECAQCGQAATLSRDTRTQTYHALTTGEALLLLTAWSSDVRATVKGATATITGGGCNAVVPLRAPTPP
ncbi:hypothetical protein [Chondromyces apiculatus]|uniref:Uncharacterized protein n=1 Tax=Chondromyces apiculatus DSM 436 TaxID=1192034 RepID=A0A017T6Y0_9BACT|nr:hypothetical protein [Chondromyces apiculatus]EYF04772.1 Hypothetical protein CAP_4248 [Chondromyces apiculatus DSM 436]